VCKHGIIGDAGTVITRASIVQQPSYGVLTQTGASTFEYRPDAKFRGFDHFTIEVCGHGTSGVEGCSYVNYEETVQ
jgi:Big-like domain-containing protein